MARTVKVAVVGSGLAGLTAAYLLTKPSEQNEVQFDVHLFEKVSHLFCGNKHAKWLLY
jgi:protoporphyrinogen oxidase